MLNVRILWIIGLIGTSFLGGCSDYLERRSQDEVIVESVSDFSELLLGAGYVSTVQYEMLYYMDDDVEVYLDTWSEETFAAQENFGVFTWQPNMWELEYVPNDAYTDSYMRLMGVNAVLDGIDEAIGNVEERDQVKAEALALRGYYYLMLVNLYGEPYNYNKEALGVPIKLTADIEENGLSRNTVEDVYAQIVSDLQESLSLFERYPKRRGNYRINMPSANILLSRAYLYMEQWDSVIVTATKAIEHSEGLTDYTRITESPFFMPSYDNSEVEWIYGIVAQINYFGPSADLLALYDPADRRPGMWFDLNNSALMLLKKDYDWISGSMTPINTLRISEAYLNRAEAYARRGMLTEALADLNELKRHRIDGYEDESIADQSALLQEILDERRRELCFDELRWFDLRRYGMPSITHRYRYRTSDPWMVYTLRENDPMYTLPFPNDVLQNNVLLEQNPSANEPVRAGVEE